MERITNSFETYDQEKINLDTTDKMMVDCIINKNCNLENKLNLWSKKENAERKQSVDSEMKTENNNSLIAEINDPEYLENDPLELYNSFDFEIQEDLGIINVNFNKNDNTEINGS